MAILLRIDVDKPYGHHTLLRKVASKLVEDYEINLFSFLEYLPHLKSLLVFLNENQVPGFLFFRLCTLPDNETKGLLTVGHHTIGLHAENTVNDETFLAEVNAFRKAGFSCNCFTKHGSGVLKLGKHHYPAYEPLKYLNWADKYNLQFFSGNGTPHDIYDLIQRDNKFWPNLFWMEHDYRSANFNTLKQFKEAALESDVVLLIHPENFFTNSYLKPELKDIIDWAKESNIKWIDKLELI